MFEYICLDCKKKFNKPHIQHNLFNSPDGCTNCGGTFAVYTECCQCGKPIVDDCIKTVDGLLCKNCYKEIDINDLVNEVYHDGTTWKHDYIDFIY